ncbi:hypothetical protein [Oceanobacillus neutriphilus]|uniref:Uncharacterized protein n=1 Tax=Oceanobacillus neutriphilus TaxID=531815 RepID=A0ABQ2NRC4_9BACI|nr:hypothetical protein [Oceanobacillus neutriphilus]GGP09338.1 hypothetical protein GCM10011346_13000 [Oceanobacillus neutriphilus]
MSILIIVSIRIKSPKQIINPIPSIIPSNTLIDGQIPVKAISDGKVTLYRERLSKQEIDEIIHSIQNKSAERSRVSSLVFGAQSWTRLFFYK